MELFMEVVLFILCNACVCEGQFCLIIRAGHWLKVFENGTRRKASGRSSGSLY
jgi:hypothetical protein